MGRDVFRIGVVHSAGLLITGIIMVLLIGCGRQDQGNSASVGDTGSVTFAVRWLPSGTSASPPALEAPSARPLAATDICTAYVIDQVHLEVWRDGSPSTSTGVSATEDCDAHTATLEGVPANVEDLYLVLTTTPEGWYGESARFTLTSGGTQDLGMITMEDLVPPQWHDAEFLDDDAYDVQVDPAVAMDSAGNAIAVWHEEGLGIFSRRFSTSGGWGLTRGLAADSAGFRTVDTPRVAMDDSGNALVVWRWYENSQYGLGARRYTPSQEWAGGTWTIASAFEFIRDDVDAYPGGGPRIVMDGHGNGFVLFEGFNAGDSHIYAIRYQVSSNSWESAVPIDDLDGTRPGFQEIAADADGNAVAVWEEEKAGGPTIFASVYSASRAVWGTAAPIENLAGDSNDPEVAMDGSGNAIAVWRFWNGLQNDIYWNRFTPSGGWETEGLLSESVQGGGIPQIAMDASGNAVVVWERPDEDNRFNTSLYARSYSAAGNTWQAEGPIENMPGDAQTPEVAMGGNGTAIAVWVGADTYLNVYANLYSLATGSWGTPTPIENIDPEEPGGPRIAMNGKGDAVVVWGQFDLFQWKPCANHYD